MGTECLIRCSSRVRSQHGVLQHHRRLLRLSQMRHKMYVSLSRKDMDEKKMKKCEPEAEL